MSQSFLNFNEKKTEVMFFGDASASTSLHLGAQCIKSTVTNSGVKIYADLKFDRPIKAALKFLYWSPIHFKINLF